MLTIPIKIHLPIDLADQKVIQSAFELHKQKQVVTLTVQAFAY
jgi:hypothetical protein